MSDFQYQLHKMAEQAQAQIDSFQQRRAEIAELTGEGDSADGMVHATVGPGGAMRALTIDPRAMRMASQDLSDGVLEAIASAQADLADKMRAYSTGSVDIEALMRKVELPPELNRIMEGFQARASDISYNLDKLRRDMERDGR